jgi:hypothetical protein
MSGFAHLRPASKTLTNVKAVEWGYERRSNNVSWLPERAKKGGKAQKIADRQQRVDKRKI